MVDSTNLPDVDINQIATDLNGKMDRDGVNAIASVCVESWHDNNGNWYRVYSDGWCEQGGHKVSSTDGTTVTLLKQYNTTDYNIQIQIYGGGYDYSACVNSKTTSDFYYRAVGSYSTVDWKACGYIR